MRSRVVRAPGRVNLIGDHTDYTGGLVFPMAVDRDLTLTFDEHPHTVHLDSDALDGTVDFELPFADPPNLIEPRWGTYIAAVASQLDGPRGLIGTVRSEIPAGAGLSSSAALECAAAVAMGFEGAPLDLALLTQRAERLATGVPTGVMDQLCIASATAGHATMIDCHSLLVDQVPWPDDLTVVVRFVSHRTLVGSAYADRVAECAHAEREIGPLRLAMLDDVADVIDEVARRRARHVVTENTRVRSFAEALSLGDFTEAGRLMLASHHSLRDDFATSTAAMDQAVESLCSTPGVFGARMTGGGFGGCVVAICRPDIDVDGWVVKPSAGVSEL